MSNRWNEFETVSKNTTSVDLSKMEGLMGMVSPETNKSFWNFYNHMQDESNLTENFSDKQKFGLLKMWNDAGNPYISIDRDRKRKDRAWHRADRRPRGLGNRGYGATGPVDTIGVYTGGMEHDFIAELAHSEQWRQKTKDNPSIIKNDSLYSRNSDEYRSEQVKRDGWGAEDYGSWLNRREGLNKEFLQNKKDYGREGAYDSHPNHNTYVTYSNKPNLRIPLSENLPLEHRAHSIYEKKLARKYLPDRYK